MEQKTYGLYDKVAKGYVRTFIAHNDDDAARACHYIVREKNFDPIAGVDMEVHHLYDFDTETGKITNNTITMICDLEKAYNAYLAEKEKKQDE